MPIDNFYKQYMTQYQTRGMSPEEARHNEFVNYYRAVQIRINPPKHDYVTSYGGYRQAYITAESDVELTILHSAFNQLIVDSQLGRDMTALNRQLQLGNPAVLDAWQELQTVLALTR